MLMDANLQLSSSQAVTGTTDSTFTYDILKGAPVLTNGGTYIVPPNDIIGNAAFFGEDLGRGRGQGTPAFVFSTGAGVPAGGTSLQVSIQGAPDNGGGTIAGLTFTPYVSSGVIPLASLLAGSRICALAWPRRQPDNAALPRFIKATYTCVGTFTGLVINGDVTLGVDDGVGSIVNYPSNF